MLAQCHLTQQRAAVFALQQAGSDVQHRQRPAGPLVAVEQQQHVALVGP
jgi:hypothetical protein